MKRLRTATIDAICDKLRTEFTYEDLINGKDVAAFMRVVMRNAKALDMSRHVQLVVAYKALDPRIRVYVEDPTETTGVDAFFRRVQDCASILLEIADEAYQQSRYRRPRGHGRRNTNRTSQAY
ncbi:hypothetical protein C8A03DRAFT_34288 [Achaetomium macrosporum]|uniref:Uncharacterized protein n=1 Tax=Achaetomium macrosporum TaxID=79813 RepID=A0AAN7H6R5_9PEZI|nr:hypothetical protein C8A03DRAFT_34288 [Achaetomium macrosporum]